MATPPAQVQGFLPLPTATFHILMALAEGDRHGYAIIQDVEARTRGRLRLSPGTLYRSVQRLLEQGLLSEPRTRPAPELDDERRRYYRVTALRPGGGARRGGAADGSRADGPGDRARAAAGVMRAYRLLLRLYPVSFRREYGAELRQAFAQRRIERAGVLGVGGLWLETVPEVVANAAAVHWELLVQDLRFARRTLRRTWGFAVTAVLVTALGVGATAAAFSVSDFVLVRPLPFAHPDRLVRVWGALPGYSRLEMAPANFDDVKRASRSFSSLAAYTGFAANLVSTQQPQRVQGTWVTYDFLATLGVQPALGRDFTASDDRAGAPPR